jgi:hypothetical protein
VEFFNRKLRILTSKGSVLFFVTCSNLGRVELFENILRYLWDFCFNGLVRAWKIMNLKENCFRDAHKYSIVRSPKHSWSSPKNFRFRRCRRSNLDCHVSEFAQDHGSDLRSDRGLVRNSSMWFFEVAILEITIRVFKFVWEINCSYNPPYSPESKYLRNAKKLDVLYSSTSKYTPDDLFFFLFVF